MGQFPELRDGGSCLESGIYTRSLKIVRWAEVKMFPIEETELRKTCPMYLHGSLIVLWRGMVEEADVLARPHSLFLKWPHWSS